MQGETDLVSSVASRQSGVEGFGRVHLVRQSPQTKAASSISTSTTNRSTFLNVGTNKVGPRLFDRAGNASGLIFEYRHYDLQILGLCLFQNANLHRF